VLENRSGGPAYFPFIGNQHEKTAAWTIAGKYDFSMEDIVVEGARENGRNLTITVALKNTGGGNDRLRIHIEGHNSHKDELQITDDDYGLFVENATVNATVSFMVDGELIDSSRVSLGADQGAEVTTTWQAVVGDHEITATVTGEPWGELEHSNNIISADLSIAGRAELRAEALEVFPALAVPGQVVDVRATVTNEGEEDARFNYTFSVDGKEVENGTVILAAGGNETVTFPWDTGDCAPGNHTIVIILDGENEVAEYSETNNNLSLVVMLEEPPQEADAAVLSIETLPTTVFEDEEFLIAAEVQNIGGEWINITVSILVDDIRVYGENLTLPPLHSSNLGAGAALPAGSYRISVNLSGADVPEASLDNNQEHLLLNVLALPELSAGDLICQFQDPLMAGDIIHFTAGVELRTGNSTEFLYAFLVDGMTVKEGTARAESPGPDLLHFNWTALEGMHNITLVIENISRARIARNMSSVSVEVPGGPPDPAIEDLSISPGSPVEGDTVSIGVLLEYPGTIEVTIKFFINGRMVDMLQVPVTNVMWVEGKWPEAETGSHILLVEVIPGHGAAPVRRVQNFEVLAENGDGTMNGEEESSSHGLLLGITSLAVSLVFKRRRNKPVPVGQACPTPSQSLPVHLKSMTGQGPRHFPQ